MDTMKINVKLLAVYALALAMSATVAWGRKFTLTTSPAVPAAKGEIETSHDKNGNTELDLKVQDLAKATKLTPPGTTYVVWFRQQGHDAQNAGELKVDDHLNGELKTTTPMKDFEVFATAESDPMAKAPSGATVFHATIQG